MRDRCGRARTKCCGRGEPHADDEPRAGPQRERLQIGNRGDVTREQAEHGPAQCLAGFGVLGAGRRATRHARHQPGEDEGAEEPCAGEQGQETAVAAVAAQARAQAIGVEEDPPGHAVGVGSHLVRNQLTFAPDLLLDDRCDRLPVAIEKPEADDQDDQDGEPGDEMGPTEF